MLYTITLYLLAFTGPNAFSIYEYKDHKIFSSVPIVECTGYTLVHEVGRLEETVNICKTEWLYSRLTGENNIVIKTTGKYKS